MQAKSDWEENEAKCALTTIGLYGFGLYPVVVKEFAYSTTGEAWDDGSRFCGSGHAPA